MTKRDLPALSIVELRDFLRRKEVSPAEALRALEERINAVDDKIGAYLAHDLAAAMAKQEKQTASCPRGGVPMTARDLTTFKANQATGAPTFLAGYVAPSTP